MAKKKKNGIKKFKKILIKASKTWAKSGSWIEKNINADVYQGNFQVPKGGISIRGNDEDLSSYGLRGIDWETELYGKKKKKE